MGEACPRKAWARSPPAFRPGGDPRAPGVGAPPPRPSRSRSSLGYLHLRGAAVGLRPYTPSLSQPSLTYLHVRGCRRGAPMRDTLRRVALGRCDITCSADLPRSEEHTSELQSRENLVCRLLLEKKKSD